MSTTPDSSPQEKVQEALTLLEIHAEQFFGMREIANKHEHPNPTDTRAWSQILISCLTGIPGLGRKKGADLADGSDVKAANVWDAIDTPRFNGCLKAGTQASSSDNISSLDAMPNLYFVLWDKNPATRRPRCRVWVVRTQHDAHYRRIAEIWYGKKARGEIVSNNFQLHPPRNLNTNIFRNTCGNLEYPLLFSAEYNGTNYLLTHFNEAIINSGCCTELDE